MPETPQLTTVDWQHLIVAQLNRIEAQQVLDGARIYEMHGTVAGLKVRASIFGVFGGLLVAVLARVGMGHLIH